VSPDAEAASSRDLRRLLDLGFGFFVWAVHFLLIYVGAALACVLESGDLRPVWVLLTMAAAGGVVWHGLARYRARERVPDDGFVRAVTVGGDAIALVAILWQLFALAIVPACA
jgi:hypothetical protein